MSTAGRTEARPASTGWQSVCRFVALSGEAGCYLLRSPPHGLECLVDHFRPVLRGDEPRSPFQRAHAAAQKCSGKGRVAGAIRPGNVAVVPRRGIETEADMKHQLEPGDLCLDPLFGQDVADAVAQRNAML